jgi:hypothetical protein
MKEKAVFQENQTYDYKYKVNYSVCINMHNNILISYLY